MANNKCVLTQTLAPIVPIMRLPSLEDLCIFDIKFLLSSRLLLLTFLDPLTPFPKLSHI